MTIALGSSFIMKGHAEGYTEGQVRGIIQMGRKYKMTEDEILVQLVDLLKISETQAKEFLYKNEVA